MSNISITKSASFTVGSAAFSGLFILAADTDPGAGGPMAAPRVCKNPLVYRDAIRRRYAANPAARQQMVCMARRLNSGQYHGSIPVTGSFAEDALDILVRIRERATERRKP